jgi:hypothetical protein
MTVNEAVLALLRPKPDLAQLASEPADVLAAAEAALSVVCATVVSPLRGALARPASTSGRAGRVARSP